MLAGCFVSFACVADQDEAWLLRASVPDDVRPLLAVIVDTSAGTASVVRVPEPYDALRDYGVMLPVEDRCDDERVYWRRGAGPPPDCSTEPGLALAPAAPTEGLQCIAARGPLAKHGFFVASRAAQWRTDGEYWSAPAPGRADAVACRADGTADIEWDRAPLADPYILYTGNFLNYLRSGPAPIDRPLGEYALHALAAALEATAELDVSLIRVDPDGPPGGYVARAPAASAVTVADLEAMAAEPPAGALALTETLEEAAAWLSGGPIRYGTDARADPAANDASAPGRYASPFTHVCRAISLAVLSADTSNAALPSGGPDRREDLPGMQAVAPAGALSPRALADPLWFVNLIARSFQHDAAIPADPQLGAAGIVPFTGDGDTPGAVFGLTAPALRQRWPGNLFRYAFRAPDSPLAPPLLVDRDGELAIDPATGLPRPGTRSAWSDAPDANLLAGGAASRLPPPEARYIHTDVAGDRILDPANRVMPGNAMLDRQMLGLAAADPLSLEDVLAWPASLRTVGDPGRHAPAVVDYPAIGRQIAFAATHDGMLHAFDAESGAEQWAWIPRELLPRLPRLMRNDTTTVRSHGIDGQPVVHRYDPDGDGRIDAAAGEHLWLLFGLGRGGGRYYALDVSSPDDPRRLWSFELPDADVDALADPVVTRLAVSDSGQSAGDWVVLLAGGYDRRFDTAYATGAGRGNALHVVDAATGRRLWSGGGGEDLELRLPGLASVASAPRALDLDGDRYLDRAYVVDVTGQLWRIEFASGRAAAELATGAEIARLGHGPHRFHAAPDVSVARIGAANRLAVATGSGWTVRPRDAALVDRVYVLFDEEEVAADALTESELHDATSGDPLPPTAPGWFFRLERHGTGEKVAGSTVTFDHALHFQTYQPLPALETEPCGPPQAVVRRYALDVRTGLPRASVAESEEEEPDELALSGLPVELRFGFPDRWEETCNGCRPRPFGMAGPQAFDTGYAGDPVKTSWRKLARPAASP